MKATGRLMKATGRLMKATGRLMKATGRVFRLLTNFVLAWEKSRVFRAALEQPLAFGSHGSTIFFRMPIAVEGKL